ncbi:hypothetical protein D3C87_1641340 [compost metagenome]
MRITLIVRIDTDRRIGHYRFRARCGNGNEIFRSRNRVFNVIQFLVYLLTDHFFIRNSCFTSRVPVHHTDAPVNPAFFIQMDKTVDNCVRKVVFHRKARTVPIAACTQLFQLVKNDASVFFFPFPGVF